MVRRRAPRREEGAETTVPSRAEILSPKHFDGVIFELDGVVTNTVGLHFRAWEKTFNALLRTLDGRRMDPFNREEFRQFVDGKPREEAIQSFLDARGITLPLGEALPAADEAWTHETDSVYGLSKMKHRHFVQFIESGQLTVNEEALELLHGLIQAGIKTAVVSPSQSTRRILSILDLESLFDVVVDATTFAADGIAGKPGSDIFMEALTRLGVTRDRTVIIESDRPAVEAGRGAGFGLIVVIAGDGAEKKRFLSRGADLAVESLAELRVRM